MTPADLIVSFFHNVDRRDWAALTATLADEVEIDYSSLFGGSPERLTGAELVGRWQALLPGFDVTQHLLGPLVFTDPSTAECNVRAHHRLDGEVWMVAGRYRLTLSGSHLTGIVLESLYQEGDTSLPEKAAARAAAGGATGY